VKIAGSCTKNGAHSTCKNTSDTLRVIHALMKGNDMKSAVICWGSATGLTQDRSIWQELP